MNVLQRVLLGLLGLRLLGLLLGFSFSGASSRYLARQNLVVREANAMSTAWLRSQLRDEPHKQRVQSALQ